METDRTTWPARVKNERNPRPHQTLATYTLSAPQPAAEVPMRVQRRSRIQPPCTAMCRYQIQCTAHTMRVE